MKRWLLQDQSVMYVPPFFFIFFIIIFIFFISPPSLLPLPSLCRGTTNSRTEVIPKLSPSSVHPPRDALCCSVHSGVISSPLLLTFSPHPLPSFLSLPCFISSRSPTSLSPTPSHSIARLERDDWRNEYHYQR